MASTTVGNAELDNRLIIDRLVEAIENLLVGNDYPAFELLVEYRQKYGKNSRRGTDRTED